MIKNYFQKIRTFIPAHKFWSGVIALIVLWGAYAGFGKITSPVGEVRYTTAIAGKETLVTSISGSGQVSASNQIELKAKASGEILSLPIREGNMVSPGTVIARIDSADAQRAVRDAQISLRSAELTLEKLKKPTDPLSLTQSENSLARASTSKQNALDNLTKAYNDGFNDISNTFNDLPGVVSGLHDLLFLPNNQLGGNNVNNIDYYSSSASVFDPRGKVYGDDTYAKYQAMLTAYNKNFADYKELDRSADSSEIEAMIEETYATSLLAADAVKSASNLIQFFQDQMTQHSQKIPTLSNTQLASLNSYSGTTNTHLSELLAVESTIKSNKSTIIDAERTINENTQSLAKLVAGTDPLDLRSAELTVEQRTNALRDAEETLANYTVRAPFAGTVAKLSVKNYDSVGNGTVVATLAAMNQMAEISLNEVDVAKVAIGQKVTLTFDAIEGLSLTGVVSEIDTIGTVTQGVVTYNVKIAFDTQDERVKGGMSVNASIITNVKADTLVVPNSAVKTQGTGHYVEIFDPPIATTSGNQGTVSKVAPHKVQVEIGLANDTSTEITSGLKEGEQVVTKTTTTTAVKTAAPSLIGGGSSRRIP
jgi:HlyD family secretion protein